MLMSFAVPAAALPVVKLKRFGSIGDPPSTPKTGGASGRSSIAVSAALSGGPGVAIDRPQIFLQSQNLEKQRGKE